MKFQKRLVSRLIPLALVASLALSGCSWLQDVEIDNTKDWTAQKLYSEAHSAMLESDWSQAKSYFTKLESRFPFGSYAQQAQIELAYIAYKDDNAPEGVEMLNRFLRTYPNHSNADYALYLKALCILNERDSFIAKITTQDRAFRDSQSSQDAFDTFKELVGRFPESRYASEARRRMHELVIAQAKYYLQAAQFYYDRHAYVAAINRAKVVISDFQQTSVSDDALELIAKSYHALGLIDLENDIRRIIERNKNRATRPLLNN